MLGLGLRLPKNQIRYQGVFIPTLSVDGTTVTIERAAPAPSPILSLTPPVTIVIN